MIKTYTTVIKEIKNPWDYHGWRNSTSQPSFCEDQREETHSFGLKDTQERKHSQCEANSSDLTAKSLWPSLNCQEAPESERRQCEAHPSQPRQRRSWQHLVLQGWKRLFIPAPAQRGEPVMKPQEGYSGEIPKKQGEVLEISPQSLEHQPPSAKKDVANTYQLESYAGEVYEENCEARETHDHFYEILREGPDHHKFFHLAKCGAEITPEAPLFEAFYYRDEQLEQDRLQQATYLYNKPSPRKEGTSQQGPCSGDTTSDEVERAQALGRKRKIKLEAPILKMALLWGNFLLIAKELQQWGQRQPLRLFESFKTKSRIILSGFEKGHKAKKRLPHRIERENHSNCHL